MSNKSKSRNKRSGKGKNRGGRPAKHKTKEEQRKARQEKNRRYYLKRKAKDANNNSEESKSIIPEPYASMMFITDIIESRLVDLKLLNKWINNVIADINGTNGSNGSKVPIQYRACALYFDFSCKQHYFAMNYTLLDIDHTNDTFIFKHHRNISDNHFIPCHHMGHPVWKIKDRDGHIIDLWFDHPKSEFKPIRNDVIEYYLHT